VFTRATNTVQFYVDGTLRTTATKNLEADNPTHPMTIGNHLNGNAFSGLIDEVRIYNRPLTAAEVTNAMSTPLAPGADATAPVLSNAQPSGVLAVGTAQTTLSLSSDENATCRYATTAGTAYGSMPNTFGTTGGTAHSTLVSGLANGQSYRYYVRCQDTAGNANAADLAISFSVAAPDTTAPAVNVSAPAAGATVTGTVSVSASASDNVAVVGVQFLLDGANLGAEVTAAPYTVSWDTAGAVNGAHSISARARDAAGNQTTSAVVGVTVSNAAPSGLIAAYGFNEVAGATSADLTGNGHLATLQNGTSRAAGRYGNALSFDGTNDQVALANPATIGTGTASFSFMAWVKRSALGGQQRHIFSKCSTSSWQAGCKEFYFSPSNVLTLGDYRSGDTNSVTIADTNWHHVALVFTRATNTVQFYLDGTLRTTATKNLEADNPTHPMTIGNHLNHNAYSGLIDEVRIYNRPLTAAEVTNAMNTPLAVTFPR
jgi:Concanavalin A-like lectin/glucanases superfamily/Bacterial Ig domain